MTATISGIIVTADPAWQRMLDKFRAQELEALPGAGQGTNWETWTVNSASDPNTCYVVTVDMTHSDHTVMHCTCPATVVCKHLAGVAQAANVFPVARMIVCGRCDYRTTDPVRATAHWLMDCPKRPPTARDGAALLLGARTIVP